MPKVCRFVSVILFVTAAVFAEEPKDFRVTAPERAVQIRVQVLYPGGTTLYDSDWKSGNLLDFPADLPFGSYQLRISSRDLEGRVSERLTNLQIAPERIIVDPPLPEDLKITTTAHDGTTGQIITTSGDLSFRFGDYLNKKDTEAMRLSPEGNLEVKGWIKAGNGFVLADGTTVDPKRLKARANASGTGTQNQIAKWIDSAGTLGDAAVSEVGGDVGIGTSSPTGRLHIFGAATSDIYAGLGVDMNAGPSFNIGYGGASFGQSAGFFNVRPDAMAKPPNPSLRFMTGNFERMIITNAGDIGIGTSKPGGRLQVYAPPTSDIYAGFGTNMTAGPSMNFGYGGATFGRGAGFFNARPDASATAPNPSLRFMTTNVERMIITNAGNVGIGTSSPSQKLEVNGNLALPDTAASGTAGVITLGGSPFIHNFYGLGNTFVGSGAGNFTTTNGNRNTGIGESTLVNLTFANDNTAVGSAALISDTTGVFNTAIGRVALFHNTTGSGNIAISGGGGGGANLTIGNNNIDIGNDGVAAESGTIRIGAAGTHTRAFLAGIRGMTTAAADGQGVMIDSNGQVGTIGDVSFSNNLALPATASGGTAGVITLGGSPFVHGFGTDNTFLGAGAGNFAMTGFLNTAIGFEAFQSNTSGQSNTAIGTGALFSNTTGTYNIAVGYNALQETTSQSNNIAIGELAGINVTGDNNIEIGSQGGFDNYTIRIGDNQVRTFIAGIRGRTTGVGDALTVMIDSAGQLGTTSSSATVKRDIASIGEASSALLKLRPVSFFYRNDAVGIRQYGLIAEEVAQVMPELVQFSSAGKPETVRYHFLAPLLLNELQKQQRTIEQQRNEIATLRKEKEEEINALEERVHRLEVLTRR